MGVGVDPEPLDPAVARARARRWCTSGWPRTRATSTSWLQATPAPTPASGTPVTSGSTYPTADPWNLTQFEILPAPRPTSPAPVISSPQRHQHRPRPRQRGLDHRRGVDHAGRLRADRRASARPRRSIPTLVTTHDAPITGLTPPTTYFCELRSRDSSGNLAQQGGFSFTTTPPRTTPAVFSQRPGDRHPAGPGHRGLDDRRDRPTARSSSARPRPTAARRRATRTWSPRTSSWSTTSCRRPRTTTG